jgi:gamma-glutamyl:cysteine ligase YbdK (ATP-grasp superfamily)
VARAVARRGTEVGPEGSLPGVDREPEHMGVLRFMGQHVVVQEFGGADRVRFRRKLRTDLRVLRQMLADGWFERDRKLMGIELELDLVDADGRPRMVNEAVLARIASRDFQTELGQFNIEVNVTPHQLVGTVFSDLAEELRTAMLYADRKAGELDSRIVMIGILPTLTPEHMRRENFSSNDRYTLLNDQITTVRGEDFHLLIGGVETLDTTAASILPESCCTAVQFHLQVTPEGFPRVWNAAQAIAGVQVALGANSPFFFGRELWRETRTTLFEQATDFRTEELVAQGVRPRVWFGERWIDTPLELFEENVRYFTALLPLVGEEDPEQVIAEGGVPHLQQLRLHNGTVYRWNRPVYDVARGKPHLRVENRVLPAGPTVTDVLANAAFYYGLVKVLADAEEPVWRRLLFASAHANFRAAARDGIQAFLEWPGHDEPVSARSLVLDELLPLAAEGLDAWHIEARERDYYLGVIEARCRLGRNGASWQAAMLHELVDRRGMTRDDALRTLTLRYADLARDGAPVHEWPIG